MTIEDLKTIDELEAFLEGSQPIAFSVLGNKNERYWFPPVSGYLSAQ